MSGWCHDNVSIGNTDDSLIQRNISSRLGSTAFCQGPVDEELTLPLSFFASDIIITKSRFIIAKRSSDYRFISSLLGIHSLEQKNRTLTGLRFVRDEEKDDKSCRSTTLLCCRHDDPCRKCFESRNIWQVDVTLSISTRNSRFLLGTTVVPHTGSPLAQKHNFPPD